MGKKYLARIADSRLRNALESNGAVCIVGAKWCGKTETAKQKAASVLYMQDPDHAQSYLAAADAKPSVLLRGKTPRLIDEWQMAPVLWDAVRFAVDQRGLNGQFILTGSVVPKDESIMHTGTGRIVRLLMRPMSLFESEESNGEVSLLSLFNGRGECSSMSQMGVEDIASAIARGGWPDAVKTKGEAALQKARDYVDAVVEQDMSSVDGTKRNPQKVRLLMRSYARNISSGASIGTIRADIAADDDSLSKSSTDDYLAALRRIFVIEELPAWNPALRSKTTIRTSPTRHFVDPSIAVAALDASPEWLLSDFETFGLFFESLCVRDLRVYAQALGGKLFHYLDKDGLESDIVIQLNDGRWAAVEVKMGKSKIDDGAGHLLALKNKIDVNRMGTPSFLMVVTSGEVAYARPDGVYVVPLACLKD
ncbi:MAG: ATP-binding protein [Coriobacteriia bacterium]|nr:ATP-binding protein [Coriobacteriia bacterium]